MLFLNNIWIICYLIARSLIYIKKSDFIVLVNGYNCAHIWEHIESADLIFGLSIKSIDYETVTVFDQWNNSNKSLIATKIKQPQLFTISEYFYIGPMSKLTVFELWEVLIEKVYLISCHHTDHAKIDQLQDVSDF